MPLKPHPATAAALQVSRQHLGGQLRQNAPTWQQLWQLLQALTAKQQQQQAAGGDAGADAAMDATALFEQYLRETEAVPLTPPPYPGEPAAQQMLLLLLPLQWQDQLCLRTCPCIALQFADLLVLRARIKMLLCPAGLIAHCSSNFSEHLQPLMHATNLKHVHLDLLRRILCLWDTACRCAAAAALGAAAGAGPHLRPDSDG